MFEKFMYPDSEVTPVDMNDNKEYWSRIEPDLVKYDFNRAMEILIGGRDLRHMAIVGGIK